MSLRLFSLFIAFKSFRQEHTAGYNMTHIILRLSNILCSIFNMKSYYDADFGSIYRFRRVTAFLNDLVTVSDFIYAHAAHESGVALTAYIGLIYVLSVALHIQLVRAETSKVCRITINMSLSEIGSSENTR